ncbi:MAG: hypothetical protein UY71_C0020G0005 [Parcubacteria group bacterium GW2011_GWB1_52_7]|nr:MAG: hypothetical protein UY64_C0015G0012 [Parcubacteria group bacterium GW2011_GWA1_51_12]KKW28505.1 MAG: hypothetical protein UY71_C0020G0005 [Parcubacteria group bacterium GW2011_GWB1_52_7]KKW30322.1 MAG: hypothetical protein UY75_C0036G0007 [Parcubacteria group bacterium GW2011_GWC2_52_8c]
MNYYGVVEEVLTHNKYRVRIQRGDEPMRENFEEVQFEGDRSRLQQGTELVVVCLPDGKPLFARIMS